MHIEDKERFFKYIRLYAVYCFKDDPHEFGECMKDWYDYEWKKEQGEIGL